MRDISVCHRPTRMSSRRSRDRCGRPASRWALVLDGTGRISFLAVFCEECWPTTGACERVEKGGARKISYEEALVREVLEE